MERRKKIEEQTDATQLTEKGLSRKISMSPVIIRKNANKSPRQGRGGHRGAQMMQQFAEESLTDFLVCDGHKCDLPVQQEEELPLSRSIPTYDFPSNPAEKSQKQPISNLARDGLQQHQSSDTKDPTEKQSEAFSMSTSRHPNQEDRQPDSLSSQQAEQHARQARTFPETGDISKWDDQDCVSDQVSRRSANPEKVEKTNSKERGLPQRLSWPESLGDQLAQLDELCSPQSSTRSKKADEKEPKLRSPRGERHPLSWPQSMKSFVKSDIARKESTTATPPLFPDKDTSTTRALSGTTPPIQRRNTMSAIMGMKRPFQKQKSDSDRQFK